MATTPIPAILEEALLINHLHETLETLPNNLPCYNKPRLLDDLCFLLHSPLFLYAISPRLRRESSHSPSTPPTPKSITTDKPAHIFDVAHLEIRIRWEKDSWATQLTHCDSVLLEGRQRHVGQEVGFVQSFFWFCEEAMSLAYEYKAREHAWAVKRGLSVDMEALEVENDGAGWKASARSKGREGRRSLKLNFRLKETGKGAAGVYRI